MPFSIALSRLRIPPPPRITRVQAYACAVAIPVITVAIQHELLPFVHLVPFILFFLAVFLVSWLGGRRPGFFAIALSAVLTDYHFVGRRDTFDLDPSSLVLVALFCLVSTIVNLLTTAAVEAYVEAQQAIRFRDDFLSVAGHELRTPLATLRLQMDALAQAATAQPGSISQKHIDRAQRSVERLIRLVDELLDVSRIRAGRLELNFEPCDLSEITRSAVDQLRDTATHAGSEIVFVAPGSVAGMWDRVRLEHVVSNLLGNAIKFGSKKPIEVRVGLDGATALLSVTDQGIGIAEQDQPHIFGRFEQVRSPRKAAGLGLGLWIAKGIVDAHGGLIGVESKLGEGATFTVELPLDAAAALGAMVGGSQPPAAQ
jgi:signal transduction histidine kinase